MDPLPSQFAAWLLEAKEEHTKVELARGPDEHWERWYGLYLAYRLDGIGQSTAAGWATIDALDGAAKGKI